MKALLTTLLLISVSLNVYLLLKQLPSSQPGDQSTTSSAPLSRQASLPNNQGQSNNKQLSHSHQAATDGISASRRLATLEQAKKLLQHAQLEQAKLLLQRYLQQHPQDVEFLLLEAEYINQTHAPGYALTHYMSLFDLPLTAAQQRQLKAKIHSLAQQHIDKLKLIQAWDILVNFVEPLWLAAPDNFFYLVNLAEAYALLQHETAMENVLASLHPDDPEVIRIRQLLENNADVTQSAPSKYELAVPLRRVGDQFITQGILGKRQFSFLLDTGASTTALSQTAFERVSKRQARNSFVGRYLVNTAAGQVEAPVYRFAQLTIANAVVKDIAIIVLPVDNFAGAQGLLGMNFMREFSFKIDQQRDLLYLN